MVLCNAPLHIGVNAARVAGVTTPPIFDLQGSSCVDKPQYFDKCFIFSLLRNFWIPQVAVIFICNAPSVQFLIQQLNKTAFEWQLVYFIIQLQSTGHMNLKNNTPRIHHITPFWDEKFINFLERGTAPPQTRTPSPPTVPRFSCLRRSTCDPHNVSVALTPMLFYGPLWGPSRYLVIPYIKWPRNVCLHG